jgi:hypothetical protein
LWCRFIDRFNHAAADISGRAREPPAKQRLGNSTIVYVISSGYGRRLKAAPLQVFVYACFDSLKILAALTGRSSLQCVY